MPDIIKGYNVTVTFQLIYFHLFSHSKTTAFALTVIMGPRPLRIISRIQQKHCVTEVSVHNIVHVSLSLSVD
jgi:hypothetical protein